MRFVALSGTALDVALGARSRYLPSMMAVQPFRALRFRPNRIDMGVALAAVRGASSYVPRAADPRHVEQLLHVRALPGDGPGGEWRRARFRLAEWRRAGVVARDPLPSLYVVRAQEGAGQARLGMFCALATRPGLWGEHAPETSRVAALDGLGVALDPVVVAVDDARLRRALSHAADREADVTWHDGGSQLELWCVDDETTVARIVAQLGSVTPRAETGVGGYEAHARWALERAPPTSDIQDDIVEEAGAVAARFALAFVHVDESPWPRVPLGAAMLPLAGALS